ncbi:MAG: inositol monophosphatase [Clostridia bacterium]|nr:inositol monophosphatase [Clostridia bacterium]
MLTTIQELARRAGDIILRAEHEDLRVKNKSGSADFVTAYDVEVQTFLMGELAARYPAAQFLCEEKENDAMTAAPTFVIDPIDGTTNFIRGLRHSCVSIGYYEGGEVQLGVVYDPYSDEMFYATRGGGAYLTCGGKTRRVQREDKPLAETLVVIGTSPYYKERTGKETVRIFEELLYRTLDIRRSGSAALDLAYVADGRYDLFFEAVLSPWDFGAGRLLVTEAGGVITCPDGSKMPMAPVPILAGAPTAHQEFQQLIGYHG